MTTTAWAYVIGLIIIAVLIFINNWVSRAKDEEILQLRMTNDRQRGERDYWQAMATHWEDEVKRERVRHTNTEDTLALVEDINRALLVTNQHYAEDEQARRAKNAAARDKRKTKGDPA